MNKILNWIKHVDVLAHFQAVITTPGHDLRQFINAASEKIETEFVEKTMKCLRSEAEIFIEEYDGAKHGVALKFTVLKILNDFIDSLQISPPQKITDRQEHINRHKELHGHLDELLADALVHLKKFPSDMTVMELLNWSHKQTTNPDERA